MIKKKKFGFHNFAKHRLRTTELRNDTKKKFALQWGINASVDTPFGFIYEGWDGAGWIIKRNWTYIASDSWLNQ